MDSASIKGIVPPLWENIMATLHSWGPLLRNTSILCITIQIAGCIINTTKIPLDHRCQKAKRIVTEYPIVSLDEQI